MGERIMRWLSNRVRVIFALWVLLFVNYLDRVAISFAGPAMMKELSLTPTEFGIILSSFGVGYMLAQVPGGLLADKWGAKPVLVIGCLFWALFTGITGLMASLIGFVIVRFLFGISEGVSSPAFYKAIGDNFSSKERARAAAISTTAITLAPAFAGAVIGKLVGAFGWHAMFIMMALPALIAAATTYFLIPAKPLVAPVSEERNVDEGSFRKVLRRPSLWLLSISQFGFNFVSWGYLGWMPSYLVLARDIDLKAIGAFASIPFLFAFMGLVAGGWVGSSSLHRYRPYMVVGAYLLAGGSLLLAFLAETTMMAVAGLSSTAFHLYFSLGPKSAIMLDLAPERYRAAYVGVVSTVGQAAGAAAPAIIGFMVSATGSFASGFGFMATALLISALTILALTPHLSRIAAKPAPTREQA